MTRKRFFDTQIREWGGQQPSRYLNVTKILPKDWKFVRVWKPQLKGNTATLRIECLAKKTKEEEVKS